MLSTHTTFADATHVQQIQAPGYTSAPTSLITLGGLHRRHWTQIQSGWLIKSSQPLTAAQLAAAREVAAKAGLIIEARNTQASLATISAAATAAGALLALGVLAMTVGLIRTEAAGDLRTLTAAGATSTTRRTLTADHRRRARPARRADRHRRRLPRAGRRTPQRPRHPQPPAPSSTSPSPSSAFPSPLPSPAGSSPAASHQPSPAACSNDTSPLSNDHRRGKAMPIVRSRRQTAHHHGRSGLTPARRPRHGQACSQLATIRPAMSEHEEYARTIDLRSHDDLGTSYMPSS